MINEGGVAATRFDKSFIFPSSVECFHSDLLTQLLNHNCAGAKHVKICKNGISPVEWK